MKIIWLLAAFAILNTALLPAQNQPVDFVNPFIGTGGHGHTYPGATLPFGMVQLSPDTRLEGWDGCSGYHYDDSYIYGFSHTHLNGTGIPDLCDILFMPGTGETCWNNGSDGKPGYRSHFSHASEQAVPGFYKVLLDDSRITAQLTATTRAGMQCYTFPAGSESYILLDLFHRDEVLQSSLNIVDATHIEGLRRSRSWASDQWVYFAAEFSKPFKTCEIAVDDQTVAGIKSVADKKNIKVVFRFDTRENENILVKVGISAVSEAGARLNLETEIPGWDFEKVRTNAREIWNRELSKIQVEGGSDGKKTIFYTALYHTMINPNTYMDADGSYRGRDMLVHKDNTFTNYTVFSLWDTYRAFHPLMTIIDQKRTGEWLQTFMKQYELGGRLPVWELHGNETDCMIGYHSIPVMVDAYLKGLRTIDGNAALKAMIASAMRPGDKGLKALETNGFIGTDVESESVSKTLEYAYDDWCIAQMAKALGNNTDYEHFIRRGQNYKNLFDPSSGFMRGRTNGGWFSPFDPFEVNFNYTEANSWQYSFSAVQDMQGFMALHGGKAKTAAMLDKLFTVSPKTTGRDQSDITGLIGQYAHGNEPSHHIAYLYPFAGQPWKTQKIVHQILGTLYHNNPNGLTGNEDCGQMSAWAVMSAMGFYQVTPGLGYYVIGTPWFDKVTLNLENGNKFVISARNLSEQNFYIASSKLNNRNNTASFLLHDDIMKGGSLAFEMSSKPNKKWGTGKGNEPVSAITDHLIVPAPSVSDASKSFKTSKQISITAPAGAKILYSISDEKGHGEIKPYTGPFTIGKTSTVQFRSSKNGVESPWITAEFIKMPDEKDISLAYQPAHQYSAGGAEALIDGIRCSNDFKVGGWLGFEKVNIEATIDLRNTKKISEMGIECLQDINAWIFMPEKVDFYVSDNGKDFRRVGTVLNDVPQTQEGSIVKMFTENISPTETRYVKVVATNIGSCPPGHKGKGGPAWIFADEITVR